MHPTPGDHAMGLRGGRTLGFTIYGGPSGSPVINCHGGLLSGHDVSPADDLASSLGLCIISPDRPGINRTSRLSNQGLLPWVRADLVPLLDYLELGTISVMGWSEGGQYALAVSLALAERVTKCAVLAGCPPLDNPETFKGVESPRSCTGNSRSTNAIRGARSCSRHPPARSILPRNAHAVLLARATGRRNRQRERTGSMAADHSGRRSGELPRRRRRVPRFRGSLGIRPRGSLGAGTYLPRGRRPFGTRIVGTPVG